MDALAQALRRPEGAPVTVPWAPLGRVIYPVRKSLAVIIGRPGVGKSAIALNWALAIDEPSVMLSLDTDLKTQGIRAVSILSGVGVSRVTKDPASWSSYLEKNTRKLRAYDLSLNSDELSDLLVAETQFWGRSPALTIVDNLSNVVREHSYEAYRTTLSTLHRLAREHDTFVVALHHVRRLVKDPPRLRDGEYAGEQDCQLMMGLWQKDSDLRVSVLKNRTGPADPTGNLWVPLHFDVETMKLAEQDQAHATMAAMAGDRSVPVTTRGPANPVLMGV